MCGSLPPTPGVSMPGANSVAALQAQAAQLSSSLQANGATASGVVDGGAIDQSKVQQIVQGGGGRAVPGSIDAVLVNLVNTLQALVGALGATSGGTSISNSDVTAAAEQAARRMAMQPDGLINAIRYQAALQAVAPDGTISPDRMQQVRRDGVGATGGGT